MLLMYRVEFVRRLVVRFGALLAIASFAPAVAGAHTPAARSGTYGATALQLDRGAASALKSLGVTAGVIAPASARKDGLHFPITDSLTQALASRRITHSGGISLTAGSTHVDLTDFWINLRRHPNLSALVGGARVPILNLDLSQARVRFAGGQLTIGPVTASLTQNAADALNAAFRVSAFKKGLVLGTATVKYNLFPFSRRAPHARPGLPLTTSNVVTGNNSGNAGTAICNNTTATATGNNATATCNTTATATGNNATATCITTTATATGNNVTASCIN